MSIETFHLQRLIFCLLQYLGSTLKTVGGDKKKSYAKHNSP